MLEYRIRVEGVWGDFGEIWAFLCEVARADRWECDGEADTTFDDEKDNQHMYQESDTKLK
jgi:hypothetical protein